MKNAKKMLALDGREAAYFDLLIVASRTKSEKTKAEVMQKASLLRGARSQASVRERSPQRCWSRDRAMITSLPHWNASIMYPQTGQSCASILQKPVSE